MPWRITNIQANHHNDNFTVTAEYVSGKQVITEYTGQVGPQGQAGRFTREAIARLQSARSAAIRKADAEREQRFDALVANLNHASRSL